MRKDSISSRGIALVSDNVSYPIFYGDPHIIIHTSYTNLTKELNNRLQDEMKKELDVFISKLSLFSKIKAKRFIKNYRKYGMFHFIKDEGVIAFHPSIPLLDFILEFCIEFNCLEVLNKCLEIVDTELFTDVPNCKISADMIYAIKYAKTKSKLHFVWSAGETDWSVYLTDK